MKFLYGELNSLTLIKLLFSTFCVNSFCLAKFFFFQFSMYVHIWHWDCLLLMSFYFPSLLLARFLLCTFRRDIMGILWKNICILHFQIYFPLFGSWRIEKVFFDCICNWILKWNGFFCVLEKHGWKSEWIENWSA